MRRNRPTDSNRTTPLLGATSLTPRTAPPRTVTLRSLVAMSLLALALPLALWVVSYPWTAALVAASFLAGGLTVRVHAALSRPDERVEIPLLGAVGSLRR